MSDIVLNKNLIIDEDKTLVVNSTIQNIDIKSDIHVKLFFKEINKSLTINLENNALCDINVCVSSDTNIEINLSEQAKLNFISVKLNGSKENLIVNLNGYKADCDVSYLAVDKESEQVINTTINHNYKETISNVYNVGVGLEKSHIIFNTLGKINKGMSKSKAVQLTRGVMLSLDSIITSEPILKINEFDVSANHGTALGRMSDDELFYLMSRGLSKEDSYKLILNGLINPLINKIFIEEEKTSITDLIYKLI